MTEGMCRNDFLVVAGNIWQVCAVDFTFG